MYAVIIKVVSPPKKQFIIMLNVKMYVLFQYGEIF